MLTNVKIYTNALKADWDALVRVANQQSFLFYRDFMDYHSHRFQDMSLLVYDGNVLKAILPANRHGNTVYSHQGLTYGGLLFKPDETLKHILRYLKAILEFLYNEGIERLTLKLVPEIYCTQPNHAVDYALSVLEAKNYRTDVLSVVTSKTHQYARDRIAGYKRGLKHQLKIKETHECSEFWNTILSPNLANKHRVKPVHSLEEITALKAKFPTQIRQFNVYHKSQLVAGTTIFESPYVAHSQYISSNADKNTLGSLDILHMHLLNTVFAKKKYFDFGISNENNGKTINKGLLYWKEGYGTIPVVQRFYTVHPEKFPLLDAILK